MDFFFFLLSQLTLNKYMVTKIGCTLCIEILVLLNVCTASRRKLKKKENYFPSTYPFGLKQKTVCMDSIINVKDFHRVKNTVLVNLSFYVTFI